MGETEPSTVRKPLWRQIVEFLGFSGIGWLIDLAGYLALNALGVPVGFANYASAIPAVTFVFLFATRKTFVVNEKGLSLRAKYLLYVGYQMLLVGAVSLLNQYLFDTIRAAATVGGLLYRFAAVLSKALVTPVTMTANFLVLKRLAEKL